MSFIRFKRFEFIVSFCCLAMLGYFGWYAFHGARGYPYRDQLVEQLQATTKAASALTATRQSIEGRVSLMRPESIDPDLLDELARRALFVGKSNDIIVKTSQ
jgi:cell division protein FtsB